MNIKISEEITDKINKAQVAALICRFQSPELHQGHIELLDWVTNNHKKVILFLGVAKTVNKKNPLDFATRRRMVQSRYPDIEIIPINDQRSDVLWSKILDERCKEVYGEKSVVLYGSRDSFIPHYKGKYSTIELETSVDMNATSIRDEVSKEIINDTSFRKGIIHSVYERRGVSYPTVDVVVSNEKGQILLAKKPNEELYRFVGGFVDRTDKNYEAAAKRELSEETGGNLVTSSMQYISSCQVDDWRYRGTESGIMTTLFHTKYVMGHASASDDIAHVEWVDANLFSIRHNINLMVMPEHRDMMEGFIRLSYEFGYIKNLGEKLKEVENFKYTGDVK